MLNLRSDEEIAAVIQREPVEMIDPELRGLFASIGIHKDRPFQPDERMRQILVEAAAVGNATARAVFFHNREPDAYVHPDLAYSTCARLATPTGWFVILRLYGPLEP